MDYLTELEAADLASERTAQHDLGPSDTGRCLRQSAYAWHGAVRTDDRSRGEARLGMLLHLGWAALIRAEHDPNHEPEVEVALPGLPRPGHADDVRWRERIVTDLKSVKDRAWQHWLAYGPRQEVWDQAELYAYGLGLLADQVEDWTLAIVALNRETGQEARFERAADPERGEMLAERLADRQAELEASERPEDIDREGAGPERGFPCDYCDWLTACWPTTNGSGLSPQAATIAGDPELIAQAGHDYLVASADKAKAESRQKDARAFLGGIPAGDYGDVRLSWRGGRELDPEPDPDAMADRLRGLGLDIPMKRRRSAVSIHVGRVPAATVEAGRDALLLGGSNVQQP